MRIQVICKTCNKPFSISDSQQKWLADHALSLFTSCKECRDAKKKHIPIVCHDCGATFIISGSEAKWYKDKNLEVPTRCPTCRAKRREHAEEIYKAAHTCALCGHFDRTTKACYGKAGYPSTAPTNTCPGWVTCAEGPDHGTR